MCSFCNLTAILEILQRRDKSVKRICFAWQVLHSVDFFFCDSLIPRFKHFLSMYNRKTFEEVSYDHLQCSLAILILYILQCQLEKILTNTLSLYHSYKQYTLEQNPTDLELHESMNSKVG